MATAELVFRIKTESADFKSTMAQVRSELNQTAQVQQRTAKSELSTRQQLSAAQSLQRQRSSALIAEWKRTERAATNLAAGIKPVGTNLQRVTDIMQTLGGASASLQGPLGGVAGRLRSLGALAGEGAGGLGIVGVAAGALVVAAAAAAIAIYKLTVSAAEFQGQLFDTSQATGISVETLSTLEVVAKTTGSSLDSIVASLGIFQKNLEDAQDPTSKEAKLLKNLGVETTDTEQALRQTMRVLAEMPAGFRQTATALELFGRGGKAILAILKETNGDLDAATERFRKMGILVSGPAAQAADKFNDRMAEVGFQVRGITALIGNEAMPTILKALEAVSRAILDNQDNIREWVGAVGDAARGAVVLYNATSPLVQLFKELGAVFPEENSVLWWLIFKSPLGLGGGSLSLLSDLGRASKGPAGPATVTPEGEFVSPGSRVPADLARAPKGAKKGGRAKRGPRDTSLQDELKDAALAEREIRQRLDVEVTENKRALDQQAIDIEEFTKRAIELANKQETKTIDRINAESHALFEAFSRKEIKEKEYNHRQRELTLETAQAVAKNNEEILGLEQDRDQKIAAAQLAASQRRVQLQEDADQAVIDSIRDRVDQRELLESSAEKQIGVIVEEAFQRRKAILTEELNAYGVSLERRKAIGDELIRLDGQRANAAVEASRKIRDALKEEADARRQRDDAIRRAAETAALQTTTLKARAAAQEAASQVAARTRGFQGQAGGLTGGIDQLFQHVNDNLTGAKQAAALAGLSALTEGFSALGQAVGQAAYAWVLYGSAGQSVRQVTAEILASVAQQAAIQAIFQLAEGFAKLAMAFFGIPNAGLSAAAHFKSAAIYGAVAGIAAVTGRAVAGNAFNQATGGGGKSSSGGSGSSGGGSASNNGSGQAMTLGSQRSGVVIHKVMVEVDIKTEPGFMAKKFVHELTQNNDDLTHVIQNIADRSNG